MLLGFRGQGQSARGHDGMGREAGQVATALVDRLSGARVRMMRVRFAASSGDATYDADVRAGVRAAGRVMGSTCGQVVLVGYSQGAEVVHRLVVAHPRRIALAVLMGDPLRNPEDRATVLTLGTGSLGGRGNAGPGARFPGVVRRHVLEVCVQADDVCNAPASGRVGPPSAAHHTAYQGLGTAGTIADQAAALVANP